MADKLREICNSVNRKKRDDRVQAHRHYAKKIYESRLLKKAYKGSACYTLKVGKKYCALLTKTAFEDLGFGVRQESKNGRQYLTIKW